MANVVCYVLLAKWGMLFVTCYFLSGACCLLRATCKVANVVALLRATCSVANVVACYVLLAKW